MYSRVISLIQDHGSPSIIYPPLTQLMYLGLLGFGYDWELSLHTTQLGLDPGTGTLTSLCAIIAIMLVPTRRNKTRTFKLN